MHFTGEYLKFISNEFNINKDLNYKFLYELISKKCPNIDQIRDFCFIDDFINGLLLCASKKGALGEVINLASGQPTSIRQIIEEIVSQIGGGRPLWGELDYRIGENMELYADITKAKEILNWEKEILAKYQLSQVFQKVKK